MPAQQVYMPAIAFDRFTGFPLDKPEPIGVIVYRTADGAQQFLESYVPVSGAPLRYYTIIVYTVE